MRLSALAVIAAVMATPAAVPETEPADDFPEPLTSGTFDEFTSEHFTFVEFFSPYCHHCQQLAPTWKKTYLDSKEDQEKLGILMRQVNCVESGDLCEREEISYYPNLRLYEPVKGEKKLRFFDTYPRSLQLTQENFNKFMRTAAAERLDVDIPSASQKLDTDTALKVVAGEMDTPFFVTFFSASDSQWDGTFGKSCRHCMEHRKTWDRLSNRILSVAKTGHVNCHLNAVLCDKLGLLELTRPDATHEPKYVMFLPKDTGLIRFDYKGEKTGSAMKKWALKLAFNANFQRLTALDLENWGVLPPELAPKPQELAYPLDTRTLLVYHYDKNLITDEDKKVLPHLLELVTELPFNVNLFVSDLVKMEAQLEEQAKGLVVYVNLDPTFPKVEYNHAMHLATTLTGKPTLYVMREHLLMPTHMQSFALEDLRRDDVFEPFIKENLFPFFEELTPELHLTYFGKNPTDKKVVVTFVEPKLDEPLFNMLMAAHQYHILKKEYYFKKLLDARADKDAAVAKLKEKNADTVKVLEEMRRAVPHFFLHNEVLFTFVNLEANPTLAKRAGWNINGREIKAGDTIVVTRDNRHYYDRALDGKSLTNEPKKVREVLLHLLDPKLAPGTLKAKLVGSPYPVSLRKMDVVHERGFLAYMAVGLAILCAYQLLKGLLRGRRRHIVDLEKHD